MENLNHNFDSTQPIKEAVKAGLGISLLSRLAIKKSSHVELKWIDIKRFAIYYSIELTI